jgi:hypothetical protein
VALVSATSAASANTVLRVSLRTSIFKSERL